MRRTFLKNWLRSWLAWVQLLAVSEEVLRILTLDSSACGSTSLAHLRNQGNFLLNGVQQASFWSQLLVKACKLSWVVLKVRVKNKSGRFSAAPSKLASILSLKMV